VQVNPVSIWQEGEHPGRAMSPSSHSSSRAFIPSLQREVQEPGPCPAHVYPKFLVHAFEHPSLFMRLLSSHYSGKVLMPFPQIGLQTSF